MSDVAGILSTIVLGVLAAWAVAGWVRSQTNRGRERLEVANAELNARNAMLAGQVVALQNEVRSLRNEKYALERQRARKHRDLYVGLETYRPDQTQEVPPMFADGAPTWFGRDAHLDGES